MSFRPRIAIIGAGPSGLALGQLLHQKGMQTTIYELRAKPTAEELASPSGMLDLHEESGLAAIRECGLWEPFQAAVGDCSESMRVLNRAGEVLHADEGQLSYRPEISRNALPQLLIQNLPEHTIKWNHKIAAVHSAQHPTSGAMEVTLDFVRTNRTADSDISSSTTTTAATYDLVIGADGAWSRVRPLVSDAQPVYTGAQYLTATIRHATSTYPHLVALSGSGSLCALGGSNSIMTQRGPQDSIRVYAAITTPTEHWAAECGFVGQPAAAVKTTLLREKSMFATWGPQLQEMLAVACDVDTADKPGAEADIKPYYRLPVVGEQLWRHVRGVTLVGDAAHLMTPWGGEGVNLALWDSLDLARALVSAAAAADRAADAVEWQAAIDGPVQAYEEGMWTRAQEKAEDTERNQAMFLSEGGAEHMAGFFKVFEDQAAADGGDGAGAVSGAAPPVPASVSETTAASLTER